VAIVQKKRHPPKDNSIVQTGIIGLKKNFKIENAPVERKCRTLQIFL
jgi:hypothetical protein